MTQWYLFSVDIYSTVFVTLVMMAEVVLRVEVSQMCRDCGCQEAGLEHAQREHDHTHAHMHDHSAQEHWHEHIIDGKVVRHTHSPASDLALSAMTNFVFKGTPRRIKLEESVLAKNDRIAAENRLWFTQHHMQVLNLISSPGSGKTMLLEKTAQALTAQGQHGKMAIITGDQEQDFDARRLRQAGAEVLQLNTQSSCHLDADMIRKQLDHFVQPEHRLLIIENVGNLVCPAAFDLGENNKVALLSCTEGEDKPAKYPLLFREASLIVLTKMDLVPHLDWSYALCEKHIRSVNAHAPILQLSARTGGGMQGWLEYLRGALKQ